jgi:hypothetical protein
MGRIWAIVRLTIAESLRTRVAIAFMLLLAGVMVLLYSTASGDGTVAGKIQMFMSYSFGLTHFLLALLVTFLACRTLDQDIKTMRIDSVITKPLARWQLLLGRWLGIVILAMGLFAISMGLTFGIVKYFAGTVEKDSEDEFKINNQILVSRQGYIPPAPDVEKDVEARYTELERSGELPEGKSPSETRKIIRSELYNRARTVNPGQVGVWKFTGLKQPQQGGVITTLRFKYEPSTTTSIDSEQQLQGNTIYGQWIIGRKELPADKVFVWQGEKPYRTLHELHIPINAIEDDGTMTITFRNVDPRGVSVHFPNPDGIELLIREGSFEPNFVRAAIASAFSILFVATLAIACGTFLSFPIASLVTLSVFFVGLGGNFLSEAVGLQYVIMPGDEFVVTLQKLLGFILTGANPLEKLERFITLSSLAVVPRLEVSDLTSQIIDGRVVSWNYIIQMFISLIVIKCGILTLFAAWVFHRREIGKVIV